LPPLDGRRIWFVGIGGAGLSGYAVLANAWGAEVAGWDKHETPYLEHVRAAGIEVTIAPDPPAAPPGWETVVSTAYAGRAAGRSRAEFLAELVSRQRAIVVAGSHGKTTTAAMIAFCLDRLDRDPAFLIGGEVPQLGGNARAGSGWLVVEGDESDRTVFSLGAEIAVVTNVDLDHHATFASVAQLEALFREWLGGVPKAVWGPDLEPVALELAVPGEHNRRNAACALTAVELAGVRVADARPLLAEFRGVGRRFEVRGEAAGVRVVDDYGHHPTEIRTTLKALRERYEPKRLLCVFQPHQHSRTRFLLQDFAESFAQADETIVPDIYFVRDSEAERQSVSSADLVERINANGQRARHLPQFAEIVEHLRDEAAEGDLIVTMGAGNVWEIGRDLVS
jgi:UDP-N-acetylmuramate--alanine ligase